jgi:hypothetical protein
MRYRFTDSPRSMTPINEPSQSTEGDGHHIHVHFDIADAIQPRNGTPPRVSRRDNAGDPGQEPPPVRRNGLVGQGGDVPEEEEHGPLLCRISQSGVDRSWAGEDANGTPLIVKSVGHGLEIYHHPGTEEQNGDADPDIVGAHPSPHDPGAAHDRRQRRLGAKALDSLSRTGHADLPYMATAEYARRMAEAFRPKR